MQNSSEALVTDSAATVRIGQLARRAAVVQDHFGDLELALLRKEDPLTVLSALKAAWRDFRDAALSA